MTLRDFIRRLSTIKEELQDKEIVIKAENGLLFAPEIKFISKDEYNFILDAEHIDKIFITY